MVDNLRAKGAVFVEELDECPNDRPVIFSAHGVPKSVPAEAENRNMIFVDATCPLVSKVHIEAERHSGNGLQMVMIGHKGHPETIGTMGQLPEGEVLLVETVEDVADLDVRDPDSLAYVTQTTLSIDDTADIVTALQNRFPKIVGPHKEDICYATTNRQMAVKAIAAKVDALLVVGAPNSSNSKRLVEVGAKAGCKYAQLVQRADEIDWNALSDMQNIGITAGASAPEVLVNEVIDAFRAKGEVEVEIVETAQEKREFQSPTRFTRASMTIDPQTIAIYDEKTDEYATLTEGVPHDLVRFHDYLPSGARILDYGCGPGTSAAYLANQGHIADAFDASENMIAYAQNHSGVTAWQATFDKFKAQDIYDGIWASFFPAARRA